MQLSIDFSARADAGISRSASSAERCTPGWVDLACAAISAYAYRQKDNAEFTIEQARQACSHFPAPPELRAWGAVTRKLVRQGTLVPTGRFAVAESSNGSPKPTYTWGKR